MSDPAHSLKNTILLLIDHLGLDPVRVIARMSRGRRNGRIAVTNRICASVQLIDEAGAKMLGIALPAFILNAASCPQARPLSRAPGSTIVVHVRSYRDGAGDVRHYAEVDTAESLLKAMRPLTSRMFVPDADGMVPQYRRHDPGAYGEHPADV